MTHEMLEEARENGDTAAAARRSVRTSSKLGFVRAVDAETAATTLGAVLRLGAVVSVRLRHRSTMRRAVDRA
jgi:hypothetical protein